MKISTKGRYALRMLLDLAQNQDDGFVALKDVAERQNVSKKYLEQIVPMLNKAGILAASAAFRAATDWRRRRTGARSAPSCASRRAASRRSPAWTGTPRFAAAARTASRCRCGRACAASSTNTSTASPCRISLTAASPDLLTAAGPRPAPEAPGDALFPPKRLDLRRAL